MCKKKRTACEFTVSIVVSLMISILFYFPVANAYASNASAFNAAVSSSTISNEYGIYVGDLVNNIKSGNGTFTFVNGDVYTGAWANDLMSGTGTITYNNGDRYQGQFVDGKRNGQGRYEFVSGAYYDGEWSMDNADGDGVFENDKDVEMDGTFDNNLFVDGTISGETSNASFQFDYANQEIYYVYFDFDSGTSIYGDFIDEEFTGEGTCEYANGAKYVGHYNNGKRSGTGKYTWANKAHYQGKWAKDKMNGHGVYHYKKSVKPYLKGKFKNNKPKDTCTYVNKHGKSFRTFWKNGKCIEVTRK